MTPFISIATDVKFLILSVLEMLDIRCQAVDLGLELIATDHIAGDLFIQYFLLVSFGHEVLVPFGQTWVSSGTHRFFKGKRWRHFGKLCHSILGQEAASTG